MPGLHVADLVVLVVYLLGITVLGVWMARRVRTIGDFFMPRRFGKAMMVTHAFGTGTHSDQAVSVASKTFSNGLSGIWYQWLWLFATPFYWLIAPLMRRFRAITTADVFEARYGRSVAMLFAIVGMFQLMFNIGVMLKGSGAVVSGSTGGTVSADWAIAIMTVLFVAYGVAGGLGAAIITDFIQGILTVVFSFLLLPYVLAAVGGLPGLHKQITRPEMFSLVAPAEIGLFYIVVIAFNALVGIVTQPHTMGNCAAGRTEMDGRVGFMGGNLIKRVCTIAWCLTGLAAVAYFAGQEIDGDEVYGRIAADFLPKILPGMLGVFLASLLASVMSSCDSFMIASSGLFTENVYRPIVAFLADRGTVRRPSDRHYVLVGRVTALGVVAGGVYFAYWLPNVVRGLEIFWKIAPMMGIAFWLGLFWRRTTAAGAWAATLTALLIWLLTTCGPVIRFVGELPIAKDATLVFVKTSKPPPLLEGSHIRDVRALARALRDGPDPVAAYVREALSKETRALLHYDAASVPAGDLRAALVGDLNRLLEKKPGKDDPGLYDPARFAGVTLSERTRQLAEKKLEGKALVAFNRRLLEEAFPQAIRRTWLFHGPEIAEPVALARRLRDSDDPACAAVRGRLSQRARRLVADVDGANADALRAVLVAEFNRIAAGESLYDEARFSKVLTSSDTLHLAAGRPAGEDLVRLNTYLLEETFLWEIDKSRHEEIYLPWQMVFYLVGGTAAGLLVSLLTRPVAREKLERFYALARTPVKRGEQVRQPCTLPEDATVPPRRNLFGDRSSLEVPIPSLTSLIGHLVGWAFVGGIILVFYLISRAP